MVMKAVRDIQSVLYADGAGSAYWPPTALVEMVETTAEVFGAVRARGAREMHRDYSVTVQRLPRNVRVAMRLDTMILFISILYQGGGLDAHSDSQYVCPGAYRCRACRQRGRGLAPDEPRPGSLHHDIHSTCEVYDRRSPSLELKIADA